MSRPCKACKGTGIIVAENYKMSGWRCKDCCATGVARTDVAVTAYGTQTIKRQYNVPTPTLEEEIALHHRLLTENADNFSKKELAELRRQVPKAAAECLQRTWAGQCMKAHCKCLLGSNGGCRNHHYADDKPRDHSMTVYPDIGAEEAFVGVDLAINTDAKIRLEELELIDNRLREWEDEMMSAINVTKYPKDLFIWHEVFDKRRDELKGLTG